MKVLIAMSGGVDSSVAAKLLCDEGYECIGCTMKHTITATPVCREAVHAVVSTMLRMHAASLSR